MRNKIYFLTLIALLILVVIKAEGEEKLTLWEVYNQHIRPKKFVDLTHAFYPGIPRWKGFPDEKRETLFWYEPGVGKLGSGFFAESFQHVGQWGTHVDPPAHFIKGLRTIDEIDPEEMVMPLVIIDVHKKAEKNPDYQITMEDIKEWEKKYGSIPQGSFVAMRTDWSKRWPSQDAMQIKDKNGISHYPGWSMEVLKYLFEQRKVTAIGLKLRIPTPVLPQAKMTILLKPTCSLQITIRLRSLLI